MQRQLWKAIVQLLNEIDKPRFNPRHTFSPIPIVKVWMWSVIHNLPVPWVCQACNWWPLQQRRPLPSCSTMSRRLRNADVQQLLKQIEAKA